MSYLTNQQLQDLNFKYIGKNVKLSDKASIYNPENISIDDNSRIDDFCILSAGISGIHIGQYVHIAAYSSLVGEGLIYLSDFSGISSRVSIYSSSDDYSGSFLTNPTLPKIYKNTVSQDVYLGKHVIIGAGSIILPGTRLNQGIAVGALSLVIGKEYTEFMIYAGIPAAPIKTRNKNLLQLEQQLLLEKSHK